MASLYKNISGTTKPTFKIGRNGVSISSDAIVKDDGKVLETLFVNKKAVLTEDSMELIISRQFITGIRTAESIGPEEDILLPGYTRIDIKQFNGREWEKGHFDILTSPTGAGTGDVTFTGNKENIHEGEFVIFSENGNGQKITGSGLSKADRIFKDDMSQVHIYRTTVKLDEATKSAYNLESIGVGQNPIDNAETFIPTAKAVTDYIQGMEASLGVRLMGYLKNSQDN